VRISTNGGSQPRWRRDGKELFYLAPDGSIMGVPISMTASGLQAQAPAALWACDVEVMIRCGPFFVALNLA